MCDPLVLAARPIVLQQHIESFAHDVGGAPGLGGGKIFQPLAPKDELVVFPKSNLNPLPHAAIRIAASSGYLRAATYSLWK